MYASGDRKAFVKAQPVLPGFSRASYYLGEFGNGSRMKFVANLLVAIHNVSAAEAFVLGMKAGLSPKRYFRWRAMAPAPRACSRCAARRWCAAATAMRR